MIVKFLKGYIGRGSELILGILVFRNNFFEIIFIVVLIIGILDFIFAKNFDFFLVMKIIFYKLRYNISEKVMRMEKDIFQSLFIEDKFVTQDYTEINLLRELMSKMFGLLK